MQYSKLANALDTCDGGLYFLAGVDAVGFGRGDVLTVHYASGSLSLEHETNIRNAVLKVSRDIAVRFREHSSRVLFRPSSLEKLSNMFGHQHIVADPTGAFSRVEQLVGFVKSLRAKFGSRIGRVLWFAEKRKLCFCDSSVTRDELVDVLKDEGGGDLINSIEVLDVVESIPDGRFSVVDHKSISAAGKRRMGLSLARLSGLAAAAGIGALPFMANASVNPVTGATAQQPALTALVGLTTFGENSFGYRNHFQALGSLRLYFGDSGPILVAGCVASHIRNADCSLKQEFVNTPQSTNGVVPAGTSRPALSRTDYAN